MSELNYLRIAQILGGTLTEIQPPEFGGFGIASASAERLRLVRTPQPDVATISPRDYPSIAEAFEEVRAGYEPDRVLVDPVLSKRFIAACRQRGVKAPEKLINKKLQAFRKAGGYGIKISKTTQAAGLDPEPFFYAAELGYVQLSYRHRVSIDDVITDPKTGEEFVALCKEIDHRGRAIDFKWAALRLRKMRSFGKAKVDKLLSVAPEEIEQHMDVVGTLDRVSMTEVPKEKGVFSLTDKNGISKYLYVGATKDRTIRESFEPFRGAKPFMAMAGPFWQPKLGEISLRVAVVKKQLLGISPRDLSLRLIDERRPLYNIPVHITDGGDDGEEE